MERMQRMVLDFHKVMGHPYKTSPTLNIAPAITKLRLALIEEEVDEVACALYSTDLEGIAHELADLLYVTFGCALAYGIDLEPIFLEVHRANMAKVGGPLAYNGKQLKPEGWKPADLGPILAKLSERPFGSDYLP